MRRKIGQVATDFTQREGRISLSQRGRPSSYPTISNNVRSDADGLLPLAGRHRIASNIGKTIYRLKLPHQELCNQKDPQLQDHPNHHRNRFLQQSTPPTRINLPRMSCENCKTGFKWDGSASGKETTLNNAKAYVTGDSKDVAILILTDIFGWTLPNIRLIADHFANESQATVYVPDLYALLLIA